MSALNALAIACEAERIEDLRNNGPKIGPYDKNEITVTLLRDGKEQVHRLHRSSVQVTLAELCHAYFIRGTTLDSSAYTTIWVSFKEAAQLREQLEEIAEYELREQLYAEVEEEEARFQAFKDEFLFDSLDYYECT